MNPFEAHNIQHLSPSTLNTFAASPAMFVLEKVLKRRLPVGAAAHRGTAAEAGVAMGLLNPDAKLEDCVAEAEAVFRQKTALSGDPRKDKEADALPGLVEQGLLALRPYGIPSSTQGKVEWFVEGIEVPIIGFYDFIWQDHGIIVDLKTQLALSSEIKTGHARQVALYTVAISDNLDARLAYVTPKKSAVYKLENVRAHVGALERMAKACREFLAVSSDPQRLAAMVSPDVESFYFSPPAARQAAFEVFGV